MEYLREKRGDMRGAILGLVSVIVFVSCGQDTFYLVTQADGSPDTDTDTDTDTNTDQETDTEYVDGIDIGVDNVDIGVPAVGQEGTYPAGEPVIELEFVIKNYSLSYGVPEGTEIPWTVRFGQYSENYTTTPLGTEFTPGSIRNVMLSISPDGVVDAPDSGEHSFCVKTLLFGDVNPQNDELCLYYTVE